MPQKDTSILIASSVREFIAQHRPTVGIPVEEYDNRWRERFSDVISITEDALSEQELQNILEEIENKCSESVGEIMEEQANIARMIVEELRQIASTSGTLKGDIAKDELFNLEQQTLKHFAEKALPD
ncbi:hypothetical protein [Streptomyces sp. NPDC055085]